MSERERREVDELETALAAIVAGREIPAGVGEEVRDLAQIAAHLLGLPGEDFRARLKADLVGAMLPAGTETETDLSPAEKDVPPGSPSVVPYLVVDRAPELPDFLVRAFGAEVIYRMPEAPSGGFHAEVRIGDAHVMMGGMPGQAFPTMPAALHLYVPDVDATFRRAVEEGAQPIFPPTDQFYGDRESGVKDPFGNTWYIATHKAGPSHVPQGLLTVTPFLQAKGVDGLLDFAKSAFGAQTVGRHADPEGVVRHAVMKLEGSAIELGEAHGQFPAIPAMLYVYVADVDRSYQRALAAGGETIHPPADQPYGHRTAAIKDAFGNHWYVARPIRKSG
jgi:PhnB protein